MLACPKLSQIVDCRIPARTPSVPCVCRNQWVLAARNRTAATNSDTCDTFVQKVPVAQLLWLMARSIASRRMALIRVW